jgi:Na+/H+ antiporter NhaA
VPALVFVAINAAAGPDALKGWAIPAATDIAFAAAVLAVVGQSLPPALRTFLLTLAIVDDLIAITVIATVYTSGLALLPLLLALIPLAAFAVLVQRGVRAWWARCCHLSTGPRLGGPCHDRRSSSSFRGSRPSHAAGPGPGRHNQRTADL